MNGELVHSVGWWRRLHGWTPWRRWLLKAGVLMLVVGLTLYPKPWLLPPTLSRMANFDAAIDPDNPRVGALAAEVQRRFDEFSLLRMMPVERQEQFLLGYVQEVVYEAVPYAYDWENWGVALYVPTVDEVFERGREDCDGRAIVAASILRRLNRDADVVSDSKHAWVRTPAGDTMSPSDGAVMLAQGQGGESRLILGWQSVLALEGGLSFGVAAFPLVRVLIIWLAISAVLAHPWSSRTRRVAAPVVALIGLALIRDGEGVVIGSIGHAWQVWTGWGLVAAGLLALTIRAGGTPRRTTAAE